MNIYENCTDEKLIERLRAGENEIMDYILEKYKPMVRKKTNAMFLIGGDNEDLIQEGMIGLFKAVKDYRDDRESSFSHFAQLCISRQLYSALEASNRKKHQPLNSYVSFSIEDLGTGVSLEESLSNAIESPEDLVIQKEKLVELSKRLENGLSDMEKKVLHFYLEGYNYIQIAEMMEKQPKSIDNALQRIRQKIKGYFEVCV